MVEEEIEDEHAGTFTLETIAGSVRFEPETLGTVHIDIPTRYELAKPLQGNVLTAPDGYTLHWRAEKNGKELLLPGADITGSGTTISEAVKDFITTLIDRYEIGAHTPREDWTPESQLVAELHATLLQRKNDDENQ